MLNRIDSYYQRAKESNQIITVFMTTYKRPEYLSLAIQSVLKQTYSNFCLVVLDNLSKDSTEEVVCGFDDERVFYVEHGGINFLYAFDLNTTKYLIVLHDDDILEDDYLENMIQLMESDDRIAAASCSANLIDERGCCFKKGAVGSITLFERDDYLINHYIKGRVNGMVFPSVIYRKSFFKDGIALFVNKEAGPASDQLIYFEIGRKNGAIALYEKPLFNYRRHLGQDSRINGSSLDFVLINFLSNNQDYKDVINKYKKYLYRYIKASLFLNLKQYAFFKDRKRIVKDYQLIPSVCKKTLKGHFYAFLFLISTWFPGLLAIMYSLFRGKRKR